MKVLLRSRFSKSFGTERCSGRIHPPRALAPVFESLTLLKFRTDIEDEDCSALIDEFWSLQYVIPGPIAGCAGSVGSFETLCPDTSISSFTHAVLFRFPNTTTRTSFQSHPMYKSMVQEKARPLCEAVTTVNFEGAVPHDIESIFRRGGEWESGVECFLALSLREGQKYEDALDFLHRTGQVASSSAFGAVQASFGDCTEMFQDMTRKPDLFLLVRFLDESQLEGFLACAPVAAMMETDDRAPLTVSWHGTIRIHPTMNSQKSEKK